jgi:site-specific recombinase XerD
LPADKRYPHYLKHSLAVALVEQNVSVTTVRVALGHKSIASTAIYAIPSDETAGRATLHALASTF